MNCLQAWKVIPVNALVGIVDMIRNRVLSFVLEIESEDPEAGDAPINSHPIAEERVNQIFNTYITGNVQNVATGSSNVNQSAVNNEDSKLFNELLQALKAVEGDNIARDQVMGVVEEMRDTRGTHSFKDNYDKFISILADHMQVFGPVVAPFLTSLAKFIP